MRLTTAIERYLDRHAAVWKPSSMSVYRRAAEQWGEFIYQYGDPPSVWSLAFGEGRNPLPIMTQLGEDYLAWLRKKRYAINTQAKALGLVHSALLEHQKRTGLQFPLDAWPKVKPVAEAINFQVDWIEKVLAIDHNTLSGDHVHVMRGIKAQILTCMRISDIRRVEPANIHDGVIITRTVKGDNRTYHPIPAWLEDEINHNGWIIPGIATREYNDISKDLCVYKIPDLTVEVTNQEITGQICREDVPVHVIATSHLWRKVGITRYAMSGLSRELLCKMSGHSPTSPILDQVYAGLDPSVLKSIVSKINS